MISSKSFQNEVLLPLSRDFFERHTVDVAQDLLGKVLVFNGFKGIISETEAYRGTDDPASHAHRGPTTRSRIMFEIPGISYIYLIYGMYYCLNVVTEKTGDPGAVLIRGLHLLMPAPLFLNGPGKICRQLKLTKEHHQIDLITSPTFYIADAPKVHIFQETKRIGIQRGIDKHWRFVLNEKA